MNIIYMHTHDTGRYIQPYGYNVPTPELMSLAQEGTLFRHAYCAGPTCSPSRSALLTGMTPHSCGMLGLVHRGFALNDYGQHLSHVLRENGFETAISGVQHEAPNKALLGYEHILDADSQKQANYEAEDLHKARLAVDFIKRKKDRPFFLAFGMQNTHRVFPDIADDINPAYVMPPLPLYDSPQNREDMAAYMTSARVVDRCVGMIREALRESGQDENTLLIFTTDHGIAFPHMKCNMYDTGIGVSLIVRFPGNKLQGKAVDALVSHLDLFPTIAEFAGMGRPDWLQGHSLLPLLREEAERVRDEIFSEVNYHAAYEPMRCVRTDRYKLIRFYDDHEERVPSNIDDSPSKTFVIEHGFLNTAREKEELFDLYLDPTERVNIVENPSYRHVYDDLSARLESWMRETNDPLLSGGKVPKPAGAVVNKRNAISPREKYYE